MAKADEAQRTAYQLASRAAEEDRDLDDDERSLLSDLIGDPEKLGEGLGGKAGLYARQAGILKGLEESMARAKDQTTRSAADLAGADPNAGKTLAQRLAASLGKQYTDKQS